MQAWRRMYACMYAQLFSALHICIWQGYLYVYVFIYICMYVCICTCPDAISSCKLEFADCLLVLAGSGPGSAAMLHGSEELKYLAEVVRPACAGQMPARDVFQRRRQ